MLAPLIWWVGRHPSFSTTGMGVRGRPDLPYEYLVWWFLLRASSSLGVWSWRLLVHHQQRLVISGDGEARTAVLHRPVQEVKGDRTLGSLMFIYFILHGSMYR